MRVGALDDHASGGLAEDVGEPGGRHLLGGDQLGERLARADRGELIGVADQHHVGLGADRAEQRDEQLEIGHRGLVDDQQVAGQRILLVVGRPLARDPAQRRVDRLGPHAARLAHPHGGAPGGGHEQDASPQPLGPSWRSRGSRPSCPYRDRR